MADESPDRSDSTDNLGEQDTQRLFESPEYNPDTNDDIFKSDIDREQDMDLDLKSSESGQDLEEVDLSHQNNSPQNPEY